MGELARESTPAPVAHLHVWRLLFNARGGWVYHCACGAYMNFDGRIANAR